MATTPANLPLARSAVILCLLGLCGCGYTTRGFYPETARTVAVPIFESDSPYRDIEFQLTQKVIQAIESRTPYKVVSDDRADTRLVGTITGYTKHAFGEDGFDNPHGGNMVLTVQVSWLDNRSGEVLHQTASNLVLQSHSPFAINVVQSESTARDKAMRQIADRIVSSMQAPW